MWLHLPNSPFSAEQAVDCSVPNTCSDGGPSATSSGTSTPSKSCAPASETDTSTMPPSGTTPSPSTGDPGLDLWMSSLRDSRASLSAWQVKASQSTIPATDGQPSSASFAKYDPATHCWRTFQASLVSHTLEPFSGTWPRRGTLRNGIASQRRRSARTTNGNDSGLWPTPLSGSRDSRPKLDSAGRPNLARAVMWPTPRAKEHGDYQYSRGDHSKPVLTLSGAVKMWPTPAARDYRSPNKNGGHKDQLPNQVGGQLNPNWVEWLMGWPIGWTDLEPLETARFREWLEKHGKE